MRQISDWGKQGKKGRDIKMNMNRRPEMTKKEAIKELENAHVLILSNVDRFNDARQLAYNALKKEAEEEDRCLKES